MITQTTKRKAHVGVVTVLQRYRRLKNGDFSKTITWNETIWVTCDSDEELWDINNCGSIHEDLSDQAVAAAKSKYPNYIVSASESWATN